MKTIRLAQVPPTAIARPGLLQPVSQLEPAGEGAWRSVGHDPYFEIKGPIPAGWYRATWRMGAAFPMPVTFFVQFAAPRRDHLSVRCGDGTVVPAGARSHLFRLGHPVRKIQVQPCARPGVFTFADFRWEPEEPPRPLALYAKNDVAPAERGWRSLGRDPIFECACPKPAGFYRLRWTARAPFRLQFKVYYGSDGNFSEAKVRSISGGPPGVLTEYSVVAHFPEAITHLQLHPCECAGAFELGDFRIEPEPVPVPGDLYPIQQVERLEVGHRFRSLGVDPAFEVHRPLDPGWYDVSWIASASFPLDTRLYFAAPGGAFTELAATSWAPRLSEQEREFRYRVRLDDAFERLQLHPTADRTGTFTFRDFRIRKLGRVRNWLADRSAQVVSTRNVEERWFSDYRPDPRRRAAQRRASTSRRGPLISILMPVYDANERHLREAIESVRAQAWARWELCIADDASTQPSVRDLLRDYARADDRIRLVLRERNGHIAEATNSALALARGEFVAFLDQDDCLHPFALSDVARALEADASLDVVYTDEDKIDEANRHIHPVFKPDWSPDTLLSRMYVGHFLVARAELVRRIGGLRPQYSGSQDYDLMLRLAESTTGIGHVPRVRYHWRAHAGSAASGAQGKEYAFEKARLAIEEALARRGESAAVAHVPDCPGNYEIRMAPAASPLVTIIIPFRDELELTGRCLASILERTAYPHFEVLLVDNGSEPAAAAAFRNDWLARAGSRIRFMSWDHPFNFASLNNDAARHARGELLLFLNNDTEVISPGWLEAMAAQAVRPGIGAVGAKLLYSNRTVQHAGVLLGVGGVAGHAHRNLDAAEPGYNVSLKTLTNYSAVTAACMMCSRSLFERLGGFDPALGIAFNDVDLCLRFLDAGLRNVYVPVELFHHESRSRGFEDSPAKQRRFEEEQRTMRSRWRGRIARDPFYNPNLSRLRDDFHFDPLPADASLPGDIELDLSRRVVMQNGARRPVTGTVRFDSGLAAAGGWFYVDGRELGRVTLAGPRFDFELPGDLAEGEHEVEVLLLAGSGERLAASRAIDVVHARIAEDELGRIAALRRLVPFDLPVQAYVEVTTACNLACVMCRFDVKGKDVPTNLFLRRELFERLAPLFQALRVVHLYGWGEPTLHRDYVDFIRSVRGRNRECRILFTSNFNNISEKLMAAFIEDRVDMINVSIDGASAAVYDDIRRHGSFEKLMATLDAFRRKKERYGSVFPHLQYEFVVQRGNVHEMADYIDLVNSLGARHVTFEHVVGMPHLEIDYREWLPTFARAEARANELGIGLAGSAVEAFRSAGLGEPELPAEARRFGEVACHEPFQTIYVNPDGTVSPCCMSRVVLGDLREQSLEGIWFGRAYNDFRTRMATGELDDQCRACVAVRKNQGPVAL